MCCDNPTDLGCFNSCEDIVTDIELTGLGTFTIKYNFNGAEVVRKFTTTGVDGYMTIPHELLNEAYSYSLAVYNNALELVGCYTFRVSPKAGVAEDEDVVILDSTVTLPSNSCSSQLTTFNGFVRLSVDGANDNSRLQDGSIIYLEVIPDESYPGGHNIDVSAWAWLTATSGGFIINDVSQIPDDGLIPFRITQVNQSCGNIQGFRVSVSGYDNLLPDTEIGTNTAGSGQYISGI